MDSKDKKEFINIVGQALEDVVLPEINEIKEDIKDIKETLKEHSKILYLHTNQLDGINRRLDLEADKRGEMESTVQNHEKRLTKVEAKVA